MSVAQTRKRLDREEQPPERLALQGEIDYLPWLERHIAVVAQGAIPEAHRPRPIPFSALLDPCTCNSEGP
ncbi:hypothetical protein GCM10022199_04520 [Marihabitans asiaticum]